MKSRKRHQVMYMYVQVPREASKSVVVDRTYASSAEVLPRVWVVGGPEAGRLAR